MRHTEVNTSDPELAREAVAQVFCDHSLTPQPGDVSMTLRADELGSVSIVHLDYGAPVRIQPNPLNHFYLVQLPRSGVANVRQDGQRVVASAAVASVLSPTGEVDMSWEVGTPHVCVALSRTVVESQAEQLLGHSLDEPLVFDLGMGLAESGNASWLRSVFFLADELRSGTTLTQRAEVADAFAGMLAGQLLLSQPHNYTQRLITEPAAAPSQVQQAVDYIEANLGGDDLHVPAIAQAVGISVRSLQDAFRKELGVTPAAYTKNRRMVIAHRRLLAADPSVTTVTRIALGVGITHLGRFSVEYRERFGETPSSTLARRPEGLSGAR